MQPFLFLINLPLCALSVSPELVLKPSKEKTPCSATPTPHNICDDHKGTLQKQRSVLKVPNQEEFAWGVTMSIQCSYGFSHWGRPPAMN
jgi:hypothetical protein